jgi:hypothetical protein
MLSLDVLYFALAGGFLVFIAFLSYVLYQLGLTLEAARKVVNDVEDITRDIDALKNSLKLGFWGLINYLLSGRRGVKKNE